LCFDFGMDEDALFVANSPAHLGRISMPKILHNMAACLVAIFIVSAPVSAAPMIGQSIATDSFTTLVSGGCGPNGWRGPWGHCRNTPYHGHLPDGGWK
jgi:hypothetical protein